MDPILTGPGFTVLPVGDADVPALLEVYRECEDFLALGPVAKASTQMVARDLEGSRAGSRVFCGIYVPAGHLAGVLDFAPSGHAGRADVAYLELLMLAALFRGHGLGAAVVGALERHLAAGGIRVLVAGVQVNNLRAIRFWQQRGFRITGGPTLMPDGTTVFDLARNLAGSPR